MSPLCVNIYIYIYTYIKLSTCTICFKWMLWNQPNRALKQGKQVDDLKNVLMASQSRIGESFESSELESLPINKGDCVVKGIKIK